MPLFSSRKKDDPAARAEVQAESVELLRRRARHRLIGSAVLVLIGIVVFPILFESQPRPVPVDIPIEIPDRGKVLPLAPPVAPAATAASAAAASAAPAASAQPPEKPAAKPADKPSDKPAEKAQDKPAEKSTEKAPDKATEKVADKATDKPAAATRTGDGARAQALLEGRDAAAAADKPAAGGERYVVQVGAFADEARAREVRQKLEKAGLKTYVHEAQTKEGRRIRVRVGPFDTKAQATRTAEKVKALDLPAAVLAL